VAAMMSKEEFDRIYLKELTKTQHEVLEPLLQGKSESSIAKKLKRKDCTMRARISKIAEKFGILNKKGEHIQKRELIQLFCRYKPELVCDSLKSEYWDSPRDQSPESNSNLDRPEIQEYYQILTQPGALLRLTGNRQSGKTTLMHQVLSRFKNEGQRTVYLSLRDVDSSDLDNLDRFLQWFCNQVSREMQLTSEVADYWDDTTGSKSKAGAYFEEYLLPDKDSPLILCLDDFHKIYPGEISVDICNMFRSWLDKSNPTINPIWQNFRMILIYPAEVPTPAIIKDSTLFSLPHERVLPDIN
jgi:ATPase subunit of ABC transporter with duplicated ATPase domains